MILIKVYMIVGFFFVSKAQNKIFRPNLPMGEYRMIINAMYQCETAKDLPIRFNLYLSKKSSILTDIKGNLTSKINFDDSLIVPNMFQFFVLFDANLASWSLMGGWKPNSMVYVTNNCCSKMKSIFGNSWFSFMKAINSSTSNCPIPMGTYILSSGFDTTIVEDNNFPKVYFYGKYKYVGKLRSKTNQLLACIVAEIDIVRPWEVPKN